MQMRRNVKTKIVASLIAFMMFFTNFATLGTALVSYAADDSSDAVTYAVEFVELENSEEAEVVEQEEQAEETEEVVQETNEAEETEEVEEPESGVQEGTMLRGTLLGSSNEEETTEIVEGETSEEPSEEEPEDTTEVIEIQPEETVEEEPKPEEDAPQLIKHMVSPGYAIKITVGVKESGYLKNAKIEIKDLANQLFTLRNDVELGEYIQSIDENKIKLKQINGGTEVTLLVPITLKNEESIDVERLQSGTTINFTCTYVTSEGIEEVITKSETPKLPIDNTSNLVVNSEFEKLIPYINEDVGYALAQIKVKAGSENTVNLPVMDSTVEIELPVINGAEISDVSVAAISTAYTNGLANGDVQFTFENWKYEDGVVTIAVNNNPVDGRYTISNGMDEYIITFTYVNYPEGSPGIIEGTSRVKSNVFNSEGTNELYNETSNEYDLSQTNSNIITYEVAGNTESFSKGYLYGNSNTDNPEYSFEFDNNLNVNISRVDLLKIVEIREADEYFEDANGNRYATTTEYGANSYYKSVRLNKANVDAILGENGTLELFNENLDQLIEINKLTPDEGNGFITIGFGENKIDKVLFRITNPEGDGILNITATKKIEKTTYNKIDLMKFTSLNSEFVAAAALDGDVVTDMGSTNVRIDLLDTRTNATINISRKDLSTLVSNDDVEITLNLNNASEDSDMYTNPVFEITLPKEVKNVDITDMNLLYGNGELSIANVETIYNNEGALVIRVTLAGTQTRYAFGEANLGTTVILNTNMQVNMYQASVNSELKLKYYNEDATNYALYDENWSMMADLTANAILADQGINSTELNIKAPEGLVNAQRISGYNGDRTIISVDQGFKEDSLETFADMKNAEMRMISINNTGEDLSDVRILGRTIFAGNTSIVGNFALGTTQNAPMTSEIVSDENNSFSKTVYYSENGNATDSLESEENGWTTKPEDLRKVKSYLIKVDGVVPNGAILGYRYNFEIPAELSNEVDMAGTFATYYTGEKNSGLDEADKVMLSTGEAPVLNVETTSDIDVNSAVEGQHIRFTVKVTNQGSTVAKNVEINSIIPDGTTYLENGIERSDVTEIKFGIGEIKPGNTEERYYEVKVNDNLPEQTYIEPANNVVADGLEENIYTTISEPLPIKTSNAGINVTSTKEEESVEPGDEITYSVSISNKTQNHLKDLVVEQTIPENVEILEAYTLEFEDNGIDAYNGQNADIDYSRGIVTYNLDDLYTFKTFKLKVKVLDIEGYEKEISSQATLRSSSFDEEYKSNVVTNTIGKPELEINSYSSVDNRYIKEADQIRYVLTVKNVGKYPASTLTVSNTIPNEFYVTSFVGIKGNDIYRALPANKLNMDVTLKPGEIVELIATCTAKTIDDREDEKTVESGWIVGGKNISTMQLGRNQNIIQQNPQLAASNMKETEYVIVEDDDSVNNEITSLSRLSEITLNEKEDKEEVQKHRIIGKAFNDFNKNGQRDDNEEGMENVVVKLCDAKEQNVVAQTTTNRAGEYIFDEVVAGEYYIKFEFDGDKYAVTSYKKAGVTADRNSDAIVSNYKAVTDKITVKENSISDIDIGLYRAGVFDLDIDVNINQVTVQNPDETVTLNMENPKLAKYDVKPQFTDNTTLFIEYTIDISNKGELPGYVKQLVDYLPDGMTIDASLNGEWYIGSDGNAYYNDLENTEIKPGETKTLKLILTKQMTENGTGIFNNTVEIAKDYNEYAIEDIDSVPGNNSQGEDDMSRADIIVGVQTGGSVVNVMIISTTLITLLVALYAIKVYVDKKNKEVIV